MKRPDPLPTPPTRTESDDAPADGADSARGRLTSLLARRRDEAAAHDPGEELSPAPEYTDGGSGGRLALWHASRRRRRAERAEVRRFTAASRRRRILWLSAIGAVLLVAAGTIGAAYSPLFAVERIRVVGTEALDPAEIVEALDAQSGRPLPLVDHDEIRATLTSFPVIETYSVEASPPHDLIVRITERRAVAVISSDAGFTAVDAAGVALTTSEAQPEGLPVAEVAGGPESDAFAAVGQVLRALPADLRERISIVRASSPEDVSFELPDGGGVTVTWGSAEDSDRKLEYLDAGFRSSPPDTVSAYDVSSDGVLVVE